MKLFFVILVISVFGDLPRPSFQKKRLEPYASMTEEESDESSSEAINSMIITLDTGAADYPTQDNGFELRKVQKAAEKVLENFETPNLRARDVYTVQPEVMKLNTGHNAVKLDLRATTVMNVVREILNSPRARDYTDLFATKAAIFYRSIQEEMAEDNY